MNRIRVVDARMGRGKTSAASWYMEDNKNDKRFLYVTPFLTEVDRICVACDFEQPDDEKTSKLSRLKWLVRKKRSVATTHSLFYSLDDEALSLIKDGGYRLIIDESITTVSHVNVTAKDLKLITETMTTTDDKGFLHWIDDGYTGKFSGYKEMADANSLYRLDTALLQIMNPKIFEAFDEVIMMTYMFDGQYQKAYLDYFGIEYQICGISNENGFKFTDEPDNPPPLDYKSLIQIVDDPKLNEVGNGRHALSMTWYGRRNRNDKDIKRLRNNLNTFFRRRTSSKTSEQLWTCYKADAPKLYGDTGRFSSSFLQLAARATNEYRDRNCLAYMVNRFADPNLTKFFAQKGVSINEDAFALSEMLQWIWRSCIRDDKPIQLYIPSKRMRALLQGWIEDNSI